MAVGGAAPLRTVDPTVLGGVELLGRLGEGGMGVVYLGRTPEGTLVAVKAIRGDLAGDPDFRRRFRSEVGHVQRVPPYCTAEVLGADPDSDPPYLVVEYVDGPTLGSVVAERGRLSPANLHSVAIGVATALTAIHGAGVIHRDLKPGNVLLAQGSIKVIDFGIARPVTDASTLTDPHEIVGTVAYMAPERFGPDGNKLLTPAADVFAWGAVVAFAATGHPPFAADSVPGIAMRILHDEPDLTGLPPALRDLVAAALAKEPADRPTARVLLDLLIAAGGAGTPISVPPASTVPAPRRPVPPSAPTLPASPRSRGRGWPIAAGVVAALLTLTLAVAIAVNALPLPFVHPVADAHSSAPAATAPTGGAASATGSAPSSASASPSVSGSATDPRAGLHKALADPLTSPGTSWQKVTDDKNRASCLPTKQGLVVTRHTDIPYRCPGPKPLLYDTLVYVNVELFDTSSCATIWLRFNDSAGYAVRVCADGYHPMVHGYPTSTDLNPVCDPIPSALAPGQRIRVGVALRGNEFTFFRDGTQIGRGACVDGGNTFRVGHVVLGIFESLSLTSATPSSQVRLSDVEIWGSDT